MVVEGVYDHAEGHVALVLGGRDGQHQHSLVLESLERRRAGALADPGLSEHSQGATRALLYVRHGRRRGSELRLAPDQLHGCSLRRRPSPLGAAPWSITGFPGWAVGRSCSNVLVVPNDGDATVTSAPQSQEAPAPPTRPPTAHTSPSRAPAVALPTDTPRRLDPYHAADHLTRLYALRRMCGSRELARTCSGNLCRVLAGPRAWVRATASPTWLGRCATAHKPSAHRGQTQPAPAPEHLDPRTPARPPTRGRCNDRRALQAIAELPDDQREVVAAVDLGGMAYAEAAALLDVPVGTVMSRLYRARERIALALEL